MTKTALPGDYGLNEACEHPIARHRHGTLACYTICGCRCDVCKRANAVYERSRIGYLAGARPHPLVNADQARTVVTGLQARGYGIRTIAAESGVAHGTLWKLIYGKDGRPSRRVRRETLTALQAMANNPQLTLPDGAKIDAGEAQRIIDELIARGWTKRAIGKRVSPGATALQIAAGNGVQAGTLRTLRILMCEPVPTRDHPRGPIWDPAALHPRVRQHIPAVTGDVAIPDDYENRSAGSTTRGLGKLTCRYCHQPLNEHPITKRCA